MKSTIIINMKREFINNQVVRILEYTRSPGVAPFRNYALYEGENVDLKKNCVGAAYYMIMEGDEHPIFLDEYSAKQIMADPEKGANLAYNHWMIRHK